MENNQKPKPTQWKAWIETAGKKLHVHGEIYVSDKSLFYQLDKQDPQGYFEDELMLVIKPKWVPGNEKVEVKYHEVVDNPDRYKKVTISSDNQEIARLNEIPKK
jgi:hypothetical protein